jgi:hypothetical protein
MAPSWRNARHRAQWSMTLLGEMLTKDGTIKKTRYNYCAAIRNKPVSKLSTEDALRVLKPLWQTRPETANRLRGRYERVWDFAKARAHCSGENPFRWRGHLDKLLPKRALLTRGHHKAMPFAEVPLKQRQDRKNRNNGLGATRPMPSRRRHQARSDFVFCGFRPSA